MKHFADLVLEMQITQFAELDLLHQIKKTHFSDLVQET
mgnify:FL=1